MARGLNSRAQNRGRKLRMDSRGIQNLESSADRLNSELSVAPLPDDTPAPSSDIGFGLTEVIGCMGLMVIAALVNIQF